MRRRPPDDSWERSAQRRARTSAGERSYPPAYPDESALASDAFAGESDDDSQVIPAITLPTIRVPRQSSARPLHADQRLMLPGEDEDDYLPGWQDDELDEFEQASPPDARALVTRKQRAMLPPVASDPRHAAATAGVVLVPGKTQRRRLIPLAFQHEAGAWLKRHRIVLSILVMVVVLSGILANTTGALQNVGIWTSNEWSTLAGLAPVTIPSGPNITDASHYTKKYGFDTPKDIRAIPSDEWNRLVFMLPFAMKATAAYDQRYQKSVEPQMLVWWTHAEGIKGRINYSNCANNPPQSGSYFSDIENCPHASFWQLGYGNQFSVIYVLKNAFRDMHGDPNDPKLVQQVGQWVLNYDRSQGTVPKCGGYSCTFPAMTIDQIMSGIDTTTGVKTADNWWASVLSRDPGINCYMIAHALTFFNHQATKNWIGNYYYEPYWQAESNRLGDILKAWPGLRKDARV